MKSEIDLFGSVNQYVHSVIYVVLIQPKRLGSMDNLVFPLIPNHCWANDMNMYDGKRSVEQTKNHMCSVFVYMFVVHIKHEGFFNDIISVN